MLDCVKWDRAKIQILSWPKKGHGRVNNRPYRVKYVESMFSRTKIKITSEGQWYSGQIVETSNSDNIYI